MSIFSKVFGFVPKALNDLTNKISGKNDILDWSITVQTVQRYGSHDLLVTDASGRSFNLGIGAILAGMNVPKGQLNNTFDSIKIGSTLKVRINAEDFADTRGSVIPVLRLQSIG